MSYQGFDEGKDRGESYPPGFTKRKILLMLANAFPEEVKEKEIRVFLRKKFDITGNTGIKRHLADLKEDDCLVKNHKPGVANFWKVNDTYEAFEYIARRFLFEERDLTDFIRSDYVQEIVDEDFVDYFSPNWARKYATKRGEYYTETKRGEYYTEDSDVLGIQVKEIDNVEDEELRTQFYKFLLDLDRQKLKELFQVSPSALENFLFPEKLFQDHRPIRTINVYFLYPFARDSITIGAPEGKRIDTKLEVKYGNYDPEKEGNIDPIFEAKSDHGVISGGGKENDGNDSSE